MSNEISPKYLIGLIWRINKAMEVEFGSGKYAERYIKRWHIVDGGAFNFYDENFKMVYDDYGNFDLESTLHSINGELLLKIAVDLGVETPDFIPSVAYFKNYIKSNYKSASEAFATAIKNVEQHPDVAVGIANSALESIIKQILEDSRIQVKAESNSTLYDLTLAILKEFKLFPNGDLPDEIRNIGSSLIRVNQNIEKLRSEKTVFHGKNNEDYVLTDNMYAYFIINSVSTVGLFLNSFYRKKFPMVTPIQGTASLDDDLPF